MKIKLLVLDIDGVLTDGKFTIDANKSESKALNYRDLDSINAFKGRGIQLALLTGEDTSLVDVIAGRLGIAILIKGAKDKCAGLTRLAERTGISLDYTCYIGDSDRDAEALQLCKIGIVPKDATRKAKESAAVILNTNGGDGVVHEAFEYLMLNDYIQ